MIKKSLVLKIILILILGIMLVTIVKLYPLIKFITTDSCAYKSYLKDTIYDQKDKVADFITEIPLNQNYDFEQLKNRAELVGYRIKFTGPFDHPLTAEEVKYIDSITKHYYKSQYDILFTNDQDKEDVYEIKIEQDGYNSNQTIKVTMTGKKACADSESNNREKTKILLNELGIEDDWVDKTDINDFASFGKL